MTTYRLQSSPMIHTPGILAWAMNGYRFDKDRAQLLGVFTAAFPAIPSEDLHRLLSGETPHRVEGETVIFSTGGEGGEA